MSPAPRPQGPAFAVHDLKQALAVLRAAAELDRPVVLVSPPAAAAIEGALWFRELIAVAAAEMPAADFEAVIDCGDHPGYVLESLSLGLDWVRFHGVGDDAARLVELAQAHGATLIGEELGEIDLETAEDGQNIVLVGGSGSDTLQAEDGQDLTLLGGDEADSLLVTDGNQITLYGGSGDDLLNIDDGQALNLLGEDGSDTLRAGAGSDMLLRTAFSREPEEWTTCSARVRLVDMQKKVTGRSSIFRSP